MSRARLVLPKGFSERDEQEACDRGYFNGAIVELENGERWPVTFYDPVRLQQTIEDDLRHGCFAERGLIVVSVVSKEKMEAAVQQVVGENFFSSGAG